MARKPIKPAMSVIDRFLLLIRDLRHNERGMALPTALFAMIAAFGLGGAAIMSSVNTQRGASRDSRSKEAIAAADAGANLALLRLNRYAKSLTVATPCLWVSGGSLVLTAKLADGWCPPIEGTVGNARYAYRVTPPGAGGTMSVVSTGTAQTVSRKIDVTFIASTVGSVLEKEGLIGLEDMNITGSADIHVGIGTNGSVNTTGNAGICGNIRHGVGKKWENTGSASQCNGYVKTEANVSLPPVSSFIPTDIATNNSNSRLVACTSKTTTTRTPANCEEDSFFGNRSSSIPWNATTRTISMSENKASLTLTGGDYFICRLDLNGGQLIMGEKAPVRIFFDTPEKCGIKAGEAQIKLNGGSSITATGFNEDQEIYEMPGFYLLGSPTISTYAELSGNSKADQNEFVMYGPDTEFRLTGNSTIIGVIAGKKVEITGNATITQPNGYKPPQIGGAIIYARQSYIECVTSTTSPPNAGC